jgi:hypothetical protein
MQRGMQWWGVRKVLIYFGFNILLLFFAYAKGFRGLGFLKLFWEIFYLISCVMVGNKYVSP